MRPSSSPLLLALAAVLFAGCAPPETAGGSLEPVPEPPELREANPEVGEAYAELTAALDEALAAEPRNDAAVTAAYSELGGWLMALRFESSAAACYRNAQRLAPDEFRWDYYLGVIAHREGDLDAARRHYQAVLQRERTYAAAMVKLAEVEVASQNQEAARQLLETAIGRHPENVRALYELGKIELEEGAPEAAIAHLEKALELQPGVSKIHYSLGLAYRAAGEEAFATSHLEVAGRDVKQSAEPRLPDPLMAELESYVTGTRQHMRRARAAEQAGRRGRARDELEKALAKAPEDPTVQIAYARFLMRVGRKGDAATHLGTALELAPDSAEAHTMLGQILGESGHHEEAMSHFRQATEIDPRSVSAHLSFSAYLARSGDADGAREVLERLLTVEPKSPPARLRLARLELVAGETAAAVELLRDGYQLNPEAEALALALARLLATADDGAVRDGERAREIAVVWYRERHTLEWAETVAMAHAELGEFDKALAWQRAAFDGVQRAGRFDLEAEVAGRLELYEQSRPARGAGLSASNTTVVVTPP